MHCVAQAKAWIGVLETAVQVLCSKEEELSKTCTMLQGWYERRPPCAFKQIIDTQFVAAMGPPGGGRNPITNRLLRHFNLLAMTDMSDESCRRIFTTILGSFVNKYFNEKVPDSCTTLLAWLQPLYFHTCQPCFACR